MRLEPASPLLTLSSTFLLLQPPLLQRLLRALPSLKQLKELSAGASSVYSSLSCCLWCPCCEQKATSLAKESIEFKLRRYRFWLLLGLWQLLPPASGFPLLRS